MLCLRPVSDPEPAPTSTLRVRDDAQRTQSLFCHRELARALRTRNAGLAEAVMRMHILGAKEFLIDVIHD